MNPYKILDIEKNSLKQEIIQAAGRAMRERKYSGKEIATAQKKLMDDISEPVEAFMCFIDVEPFLKACAADLNAENISVSETEEKLKYLLGSEDIS
ncbi:MAG: hypothetical protein BWK80_11590 [Desulfobacteraceae bacterium IS3]|nr:MAG: hypothetical protein BWK80_11590 [Desulfobacteraceae bacterium IS3]